MTFAVFSQVLERIEATTLRNQMTVELAALFGSLEKDEIEPACWLLLGRVYPPYEGVEFQFAEKMMLRAIASTYNADPVVVTSQYKKVGDMGEIAMEFSKSNYQLSTNDQISTKTITSVFQELRALAADAGEGSQDRKIMRVVELLKVLDPLSVRYIVRIILTKLRLGFSDMTMLDALSWAIKGDKSASKLLEDAYQNKHDIGKLATAWLTGKEKALENFEIELGIPIQPALCQRLKTAQEMIEKMGKIFAESKYDGTRVQIHIKNKTPLNPPETGGSKGGWNVRTFTRSLEESSAQFPELTEAVKTLGEHDLILDSEAVGFDPQTGKLKPFQETIQRKRKHGVTEKALEIPLHFYVFDVLYLDEKSLLGLPLFERKKILHDVLANASPTLVESSFVVTDNADELRAFHKTQLDAGLEGAVIKQYDSVYQPGRKGWSWVKFKEAEGSAAKLSDTIDAVVMGYWYGKGKRTGFGVGAFLIGVMGSDGKILTLSKVGTGLVDEQWRELKTRCSTAVAMDKPQNYVVDKLLVPDVWVDPSVIVEVAADEITVSPNHSAGVALRFPRLVRFRDDKKLENITTQGELAAIG